MNLIVICNYFNLYVLPLKIHNPAIHTEFNKEGDFFKEDTLNFTGQQMDRFIAF